MSITSEITNAASETAKMQAKTDTTTGAASANLSSTEFLNLMMKQLQYQDPTDPVDNKEFISQQCQFTQLSTTQDISKKLAQSTSISQTLSLVGKDVTLVDPDNVKKTITGTVQEAKFTSDGGAIVVNGKPYSIGLIQSVREHSATAPSSSSGTGTGTDSGSGSGSGSETPAK